MSHNHFNCLIGEIISGFVRTEFLLSDILGELLGDYEKFDFFAESRTAQKLNDAKNAFAKSGHAQKELFIELLERFDQLREKRNTVVHSLALSNQNEDYIFHSYRNSKEGVTRTTQRYNTAQLRGIVNEIVAIHNGFYKLHFYDKHP